MPPFDIERQAAGSCKLKLRRSAQINGPSQVRLDGATTSVEMIAYRLVVKRVFVVPLCGLIALRAAWLMNQFVRISLTCPLLRGVFYGGAAQPRAWKHLRLSSATRRFRLLFLSSNSFRPVACSTLLVGSTQLGSLRTEFHSLQFGNVLACIHAI